MADLPPNVVALIGSHMTLTDYVRVYVSEPMIIKNFFNEASVEAAAHRATIEEKTNILRALIRKDFVSPLRFALKFTKGEEIGPMVLHTAAGEGSVDAMSALISRIRAADAAGLLGQLMQTGKF
jgi:hypothetical protein